MSYPDSPEAEVDFTETEKVDIVTALVVGLPMSRVCAVHGLTPEEVEKLMHSEGFEQCSDCKEWVLNLEVDRGLCRTCNVYEG